MVHNRSDGKNHHFVTYKQQQTTFDRQKKLTFLPEMQSEVTTKCDNSRGTSN